MKTIERFENKVDFNGKQMPHMTTRCYAWTASKDKSGYGRFNLKNTKSTASRVAWTLYIGEIPKELFVCHHCDNPECTRPEHLFLGTPKDNSEDMARKKTHCKRGHIFDEINTYIWNNVKHCRACRNSIVKNIYRNKKDND